MRAKRYKFADKYARQPVNTAGVLPLFLLLLLATPDPERSLPWPRRRAYPHAAARILPPRPVPTDLNQYLLVYWTVANGISTRTGDPAMPF